MSKASRDKGKRGELEFANALAQEIGIRLVRNLDQWRDGGSDLILEDDESVWTSIHKELAKLSFEVKRQETQNQIKKWWQQTLDQANGTRKTPVLCYRLDYGQWRIRAPLKWLGVHLPYADLDGTAELSLPAFCSVVREKAL